MRGPYTVDASRGYTARCEIWHRKRPLPKREPRWLSELAGATRTRVDREGTGANLPALLGPEGLAKVLASAQARAAREGAPHVAAVSIYITGAGVVLASWNAWRGTWTARDVAVRDASPGGAGCACPQCDPEGAGEL